MARNQSDYELIETTGCPFPLGKTVEEQKRIEEWLHARREKAKRENWKAGYFYPDFIPAICPRCGKVFPNPTHDICLGHGKKTNEARHHIVNCIKGCDVVTYPSGTIRIREQQTI